MDAPYEGSFGAEIRDALFSLDSEVAFTNHGSVGTVPRPVLDAQVALLRLVEKQPDSWYRCEFESRYFAACDAAAEFIGASSREVVLVDNATTAVNTVLRSIVRGPKDGVLVTSFSYKACSIAARAVCEATGATLHEMEINLPIVDQDSIVQLYRDYLDNHPDVTFALVDYITSPSAVVLPVREIVRECRERGVRVMVDGAHAPGQLPLNISELGAEFFTGNLHKWVFCPRGCAVLYVRDDLQDSIKPLVASHSHYSTFRQRFFKQATRDMASFCMAPTAIDSYNKIGGLTAVTEYNTSLVSWATDMLCQRLSLSRLPIPHEMRAPFMSLMLLPVSLGPASQENEVDLQERIFHKYNVLAAICSVDNRLYCRISAQVYNIRSDYERLAAALEQEIKQRL